MTYQISELEEFCIIGIAARTTNQNRKAETDISELWQRFARQGLINQIPGKESTDIYCVYTDYETDHNGPYTTILGCKVTTLNNVPEQFIGKTIPACEYHVYTSTGKLPECVIATWQHIWASETGRKFVADFEIYNERSQNPENAEVQTYVSVG